MRYFHSFEHFTHSNFGLSAIIADGRRSWKHHVLLYRMHRKRRITDGMRYMRTRLNMTYIALYQLSICRYHRKFNKKSKRWTISQVKIAKTYKYVQDDLLPAVIEKRLNDVEPIMRKATLSPSDPRKISSTIAPVPPTNTTDLVIQHKSRGLRKWGTLDNKKEKLTVTNSNFPEFHFILAMSKKCKVS